MRSFVRNGLLCVTENEPPVRRDIVIESGKICEIREPGTDDPVGSEIVIDAGGCLVAPGLIDLHVHFRDPGAPEKEDTASGCQAANKGGFTTVCVMPNTDPVIDTKERVLYLEEKAALASGPNVLPVAAITVGQKGRRLTDMKEMAGLATRCAELSGRGIAAVSEDGKSVLDSGLMKEAMELAASCGVPVFSHCEDPFFHGSTPEAEEIVAARDILLALRTGCHLHICHVSTAGTVDLIRYGKAKGAKLTAETAPHYFTLTEDAVDRNNGMAKMNPPLRTAEDREAIRQGLADGTIDVIATDHAPHEAEKKICKYEDAANGISGLETAFALGYTELVKTGYLSLYELLERMSKAPASILGIHRGRIEIGSVADLTLIDLEKEWVIDPENFASKGKNTPFAGKSVFGRVKMTMVEGKVTYDDRPADR
ncbi:MAG: dihydroorotase [Firmicutes bacterium HGW-Firmicutes-11]|nr:MAG: dihydroorotase [Firmicutes bacterium HGW-Firmicutes-11]